MPQFVKKLILLLLFIAPDAMATPRESHIVYNIDSRSIINAKNHNDIHAIASLTKLMTAIVAIDSGNSDSELLSRLLIRSDNLAADEIAKKYPGVRTEFIKAMNARAAGMGLINTVYHDPSGLSVFNRSTAYEYINVIIEAEKYTLIKQLSSTFEKTIVTARNKKYTMYNTNRLLQEYTNITLSKTGFTSMAGRCLALVVDGISTKHVIVILGEYSPETRTKLARELISLATQ